MPKTRIAKQKVTFTYQAADAKTVLLAGDFTGWQHGPLPMTKGKDGFFKKTVSLPPGRYQYRLLVDGHWCDDPNCPNHQANDFGGENCVCIVDGAPTA